MNEKNSTKFNNGGGDGVILQGVGGCCRHCQLCRIMATILRQEILNISDGVLGVEQDYE